MRVRPPKTDVQSPTSTFDPYYYYKSKENVSRRTPRDKLTRSEVSVTTPLGLHNGRINLNTANTKVNAGAFIRPRVSNYVAISPPHQPKRIKTEQPEHKVTSLAHPKPIKREHANKSTSSCGPVASLNNAGTKENAGVLRPRVLNHVAVPPHQHTRINREQLDHQVTSLAYPPPTKREHAVKSSGGPVASLNNAYTKVNAGALHNVSNLVITTHQHKRINTEQPEHNYARSAHTQPTKREYTDKSTSSGGPVASLNNAYTKVNAGALHNVSNLVITTHQHKQINTEQPEHDYARSAHTQPTKREHADKSSGGPVAKRIKTEQPDHKVVSSVQPKPTKREGHADRATSRPTVENESYWLQKKLVYIDMVKRHMTERPDDAQTSVTHAKTELLTLMTHVAGQTRSDSTQWQHPSDLTCRKYRRRFEQRTPVVPLGAWKEQNSKIGRRFYRVPHGFYRTPVYL